MACKLRITEGISLHPRRKGLLVTVAVALCVGAVLTLGYMKRGDFAFWSRDGGEVHSGMGTEIMFMRTPGGLLEVSSLRVTEQFDKRFVYELLGLEIGETVAHARVPATYRYHIELAPLWKIERTDDVFRVVTPPVKPSLPVAVDLARLEQDEGGTWLLLPFNADEDREALLREITGNLAQKAASPAYLALQRDDARKTVTEFVQKWLVTQEPWKSAKQPRIEVEFSN
jgi:hypothetical protein